ncbi:hypothetical protein Lal_00022691 [Lupinus albus]|nr:hypothetical protein Lal_00022691 [Lupinus albus]
MSISHPFDMINDVNDSKQLWKIVVRITKLWYVQIPPKRGHLEIILMDSKKLSCLLNLGGTKYKSLLHYLVEYKTYVMHNFDVMLNDLQFKACDHLYRMQFTTSTTVQKIIYHDIPHFEYDFKKFGEILADNFRSYLLIS